MVRTDGLRGRGSLISRTGCYMVHTDGLRREAHRSPRHVGEGGHVEDIVVWEEEKIMGIVEPVNVVQLVLK